MNGHSHLHLMYLLWGARRRMGGGNGYFDHAWTFPNNDDPHPLCLLSYFSMFKLEGALI